MVRNQSGISITEVLMTVAIGSIITLGAFKLYSGYISGNASAKSNVEQQEHFIRTGRFMEKDIRMAGLNLPGNGLKLDLTSENNHMIHVFHNKENRQTTLTFDATEGNDYVIVDDFQGALANEWICLSNETNVEYYKIAGVVDNEPGLDRINISGSQLGEAWAPSNTTVFIACGIGYAVETDQNGKSLVRRTYDNEYHISSQIEKMTITPKDESGQVIPSQYELTRIVNVQLISNVEVISGGNMATSSFNVHIRNYN